MALSRVAHSALAFDVSHGSSPSVALFICQLTLRRSQAEMLHFHPDPTGPHLISRGSSGNRVTALPPSYRGEAEIRVAATFALLGEMIDSCRLEGRCPLHGLGLGAPFRFEGLIPLASIPASMISSIALC